MATKGKVLRNQITGQEIKFIQTAKDTHGALLEMESAYDPHSKEPAAHYHPRQEEFFTVLEGELTVRTAEGLRILKPGETLHIPPGKVHSMWNGSDLKTVVNWKVQPAFDTEYFLETGIGLVNDHRTDRNGMPNLLQVALLANRFSPVFRLAKPPYLVQKIVFAFLTPIALALGLRPVYKKYLD